MKKSFFILILFILLSVNIFPTIPAGYYDSATGTGATLKTQLYNIIKGHNSQSYGSLYTAYETTDNTDTNVVWDMYSFKADGTNENTYHHTSEDQCGGSCAGEGVCYNREHSMPSSWFNDASPMYTDLFMVYPTDGYVNNRRSNYPFGENNGGTWTSSNGSKVGNCTYPGYLDKTFEPIDIYKGDFARTYFYIATRYENIIAGWENNSPQGDAVLNGTSYPCYETWYIDMMRDWHNLDPVSQKEINRNDAVYAIQGNRNPFIDHPEWVCEVWGGNCGDNCDTNDTTPPDWTSSGVSNITSGSVTSYSATLSWDPATDSENDTISIKYDLYRSNSSSVNTSTAQLVISDITSTSTTDNSLSASTTYYYKVVAKNCVPLSRTATDEAKVTTLTGTTAHAIYDVQYNTTTPGTGDFCYPSPNNTESGITLTGTVTANTSDRYIIAEASDAWHGICVYDSGYSPNLGDNITVTGTVYEYYGLTELKTLTDYTLNSTGNSITPTAVDIDTIGGTGIWGASCDSTTESYEGVLITLYDVVVSSPLSNHGYWKIKDASGTMELSCDDVFYQADLSNGQTISQITGILLYTYNYYRLNPRSSADINTSVSTCDYTDITPPVFSGGISGINVSDPQTGNLLNISWNTADDPGNSNSIKYALYRKNSPSFTPSISTLLNTGIIPTSYQDNTTDDGLTYYYIVQAYNCAGCQTNNTDSANGTSTNPAIAPTLNSATAGIGQVTLGWSSVTGSDHYEIYYSTTDGGPYTYIDDATNTDFIHNNLTNGITYYYVVRNCDTAKYPALSPNSNQRSATPNEDIVSNEIMFYPNPSSGEVHIEGIPQDTTISIYTIKGELVKKIENDEIVDNQYLWDGKNSSRKKVNSGIYIAVLKTDGKQKLYKIAIIR